MKIIDIAEALRTNAYPGRGIILGRSADNTKAVIAYFIMGRSVNSRNRIFTVTEDGIRTEAHDPSKMVDPSLIIYHPVRYYAGKTIVTNGDQTDTIWEAFKNGQCYRHALNTRTFEPDGPNYTPRISGVLKPNYSYNLSILKSFNGDPSQTCRYFWEYDAPVAGYGHFIHTYMQDGNPLPSFEGEPELLTIQSKTATEFADLLWANLNSENKVSLFVRYVDMATGETDDVIKNINE
ncbi:MAG: IMP cyclohydrolase [Oscillospiraceae bacterium]|nr:IMP cyclohydrolase [Oscillospiraceae bacterium]